jgi:hypothetical protein
MRGRYGQVDADDAALGRSQRFPGHGNQWAALCPRAMAETGD